MLCIVVHRRSW